MENFTPASALLGGALIGLAAVWFMFSLGRIAGISGIVGGLLNRPDLHTSVRLAFVIGLVVGPVGYVLIAGAQPVIGVAASPAVLVVGGFLVGFGTRLGSGCTSGHGVCGIARLSKRSITATLIFMTTAIVTVYLTRHVWGLTS